MAEPHEEPADTAPADEPVGRVFSLYGVASTVLALVAVAAAVLCTLIWSGHREHADELRYRTRVMQTATDWTGVLINMNKDNIEASLQKLHDGTVGELNADFDAAVTPYRDVVRTLQSRTSGQIEAVAYESVHHDLDTKPGSPPPAPSLPTELAARTDTVIVVASSVSENVGGTPQTVRWNLRLGVSDVDGELLISRLESMR
jgi:hypothetical protein